MNACELFTAESSWRLFPAVCRFLPDVWDPIHHHVRLRRVEPADLVEHLERATLPVVALVEVSDPADASLFPALSRSMRRRQRLLFASPLPPLPLAGPQCTSLALMLRQLGFALVLTTAADVPLALRMAQRFVARQPTPHADVVAEIRSRLPWPRHAS